LQYSQQIGTGFFAELAGLRAEPAVAMLTGMALTYLPAYPARRKTGFQLFAQYFGRSFSLPGHHLPGDRADGGAVQSKTNAPSQHFDPCFAKTGIGTKRTALRAGIAGFYTGTDYIQILCRRGGMDLY
jgi:hypothetical protein